MVITDPAVKSARLLGLLENYILATCRACPTKILLDWYQSRLQSLRYHYSAERTGADQKDRSLWERDWIDAEFFSRRPKSSKQKKGTACSVYHIANDHKKLQVNLLCYS